MTWCPRCDETYPWYERECPECGAELEDERPKPQPLEAVEMLSVLRSDDPGLVALAVSVLDGEGIEYVLKPLDMEGFSRALFGAHDAILGPSEILVRADDTDRAKALLQPLEEAGPLPTEPDEPDWSD